MLKNIIIVLGSFTAGLLVASYVIISMGFSPLSAIEGLKDKNSNVETVTVSFDVPADSTFNENNPEKTFKKEDIPDVVTIPLPLDVVGENFIYGFNSVLNGGNALEIQMRSNVATAMYEVQKEAAAGNYLVMFAKMLEAKEENKTAYALAENLYKSASLMEVSISAIDANEVKIAAQTTVASARSLSDSSIALLDSLEKALSGSVPSPELLEEIERLSAELDIDAQEFAQNLIGVTASIKRVQ